jgi:2-polyprenyl-3-methyl-5-hydroxy-6-metoxy-1,4-benzoquinol methylase
MNYISTIDISNKNNSHTIAIDFIVDRAQFRKLKILDVGCSEGYLGAFLKSLGHYVTGVELNSNAVEKANILLDFVFSGSIHEFFISYPESKFDCIIFGDVLEHLSDPHEVLVACHNHLELNGFLIASLPNVSHAAIRAMLLNGRWDYSDLGILDRTHLKFFTKETAAELFKQTNFDVLDTGQVQLPIEVVANLCNLTLDETCVDIVKAHVLDDPDSYVFQNIFLVEPISVEKLRVVAYVPNKSLSLFDIRVKQPLENWKNRYSGIVKYREYNNIKLEDLHWGDVFIFQRTGGEYILNVISVLQKHGKKCIFELDDLLTEIPDFLSHHKMSSLSLELYYSVLSRVDYITTTTDRLAAKLKEVNPNVHCIPNCVTFNDLPLAEFDLNKNHKVTLVVASSDSVLVDFLVPALKEIQNKYPNNYDVLVIGPPGDFIQNSGVDITRFKILSYVDFKILISSLTNPIALIPLDHSLFSSCKSPIKYFDYVMAGIPVICSNVPPYSDYMINLKTGILVNNTVDDWVLSILKIHHDSNFRTSIISDSINYVKDNFNVDVSGNSLQALFEKLSVQRSTCDDLLDPKTYISHSLKSISLGNDQKLEPILKVKHILLHILKPVVYKKVYRVLIAEGFTGLFKRLKNI